MNQERKMAPLKRSVREGWDLLRAWLRYQRAVLGLHYKGGEHIDTARILAVEGLMTDTEVRLLRRLASEVREGCIVEIGSYHGRSTVALAQGAREGAGRPVYAVDPYLSFRGPLGKKFGPRDKIAFMRNVVFAGLAEGIWTVHLPSEQAARSWDTPVSLLWIDGDHTYEGVRKDWESWAPFLVPGGRAAFHDSLDPRLGVFRLIPEILEGQGFRRVEVVDKVTVLEKVRG